MSLYLTNSGASLVLAGGGVPTAKGLLAASDFTYIGSFRTDHEYLAYGGLGMGWNPTGNSGAGTLLLAGINTAGQPFAIVEGSPATPTISATGTRLDLPNFTAIQVLTNPTGGVLQAAETATGLDMTLRGVTVAQLPNGQYKLFWGFSPYFTNDTTGIYGIGYSDLDGTNPKGGWRLYGKSVSSNDGPIGSKRVAFNLHTVPQAWADANTGGRAIVAGGIDYQLMGGSCGGHSAYFWAPWVDDPVTYAPSANSSLSVMTGADYTMSEYANPDGKQMEYPAGVQSAGYKPVDHNFFWTKDSFSGLNYVTTSDGRSGFVCAGAIAGLFSSYDLSGNDYQLANNASNTFFPHGVWPDNTQMFWGANGGGVHGQVAGTYRCGLFLYDPADYLAVFANTKNMYDVMAYDWKNIYLDLSYNNTVGVSDGGTDLSSRNQNCINWPNQNWNWLGTWAFHGSAYDPVTRRLYLLQEQFYSNGIASQPAVHVYQVS